jgi:serine/threonine protein kinase
MWADDERETWTTGKHEAYLQFLCRRTHNTEATAYDLLEDLQGKQIPAVLAHSYLRDPSDQSSGELSQFLNRPGLLLEYVEGFPLTDLAEQRPKEDWQYVCDEAIRIVHLINERGVCNKDIKTLSFIVRDDHDVGKLRVYMIDFGLCAFRSEAEDEIELRGLQADEDQEGAVGRVMESRLDGGFK